MGHRHTPEECRGARTVRGADGGTPAPVAVCVTPEVLNGTGVRIALLALRVYQTYLSVLFAGSCRFEPTCSQYAYEAIERFGVARGVWLGMKRLLRCHPLSRRFGHDPVPEKWEEMPSKTIAAANEVHL
jgi:uncharacterized protein